jgi:hypothetical protein
MLLQTRSLTLSRGASVRVSLPVAIVAGSLLLGFLSLLLPSSPTYDPLAWIIWGREISQLDLNTVDGPSWKPLPVILTTITAPLGEASPFIWVAVARAGAIAAVVLAFLAAARLAGPVAGAAAAGGLALMDWHIRNGALGNSEGLMVALVLGALLAHTRGRRGWAFALAIGAALLRPEAWPFLGVYVLWLLYEDRHRWRWIVPGLASLPILWLGPELWGSGNAFRASDRAQNPNPNSPAFADNPALEVVKNAIGLAPAAAVTGAALAVGLALLALQARGTLRERLPDRDRALTVLVLAVLAAAWIALVAVMTVRGFSGNSRYLLVPAALIIVIGAAGIVWAVRALAPRVAALPAAALAAAAAALIALFALPDADRLEHTLVGIEYQADLYHDLGRLVDDAGGPARLRECGHAFTGPFLVPAVAWHLKLHSTDVDLVPETPAVIFHVRTTEHARIAPPPADARPNVLGREGHWLLTADCAPAS